jgi:hypothetical protein
MEPSEVFEIWAPPGSIWSRWAKPVLFAASPPELAPQSAEPAGTSVSIAFDPRAAVIIDLPGVDSVLMGLGFAARGYRPVPLYNGNPGPSPLVPVLPIQEALFGCAPFLKRLPIADGAPPAFLLDSNRLSAPARKPGQFDNRWIVFPQDFPSANFLRSQAIERVLLVRRDPGGQPQSDLAHVLLRWQEAGIELLDWAPTGAGALRVSRPSRFRVLWYRTLAVMGLRRNSAGGFGAVVPQPPSGSGFG